MLSCLELCCSDFCVCNNHIRAHLVLLAWRTMSRCIFHLRVQSLLAVDTMQVVDDEDKERLRSAIPDCLQGIRKANWALQLHAVADR
jgi:nitric oxide synthase oxygenase domain/subunit